MNRYTISIPLTLAEDLAKDGDQQKAKEGLRELLSAYSALLMENQQIKPVRYYTCLACGGHHAGSGNLPCPKMSPYSGVKP